MALSVGNILPQRPQSGGGVRAGAESFGAREAAANSQMAQSIGRAGSQAHAAVQQAQQERKETDFLEKQMAYEDGLRAFDTNYKQTKRGKDALTAAADYAAENDRLLSEIGKSFKNEKDALEFNKRVYPQARNFVSNGARWEIEQDDAHKTDTVNAYYGRMIEQAKNPGASPEAVNSMWSAYETEANKIMPWRGEAQRQKERQGFMAARQESVVQRDTATTQGNPAFAESLPRELEDAPEEYRELFTPVEYDAHRARLAEKGKAATTAQKAAYMNGLYEPLYQKLKDLPEEEARVIFAQYIDQFGDYEVRNGLNSRFDNDFAALKKARDDSDYLAFKKFQEYASGQGLTPSQAITAVDQAANMSEGAKEKVKKYYTGEADKPTPENREKARQGLVLVDAGALAENEAIERYAWDHGLTGQQKEALYNQRDEGGNKIKVTYSSVNTAYKRLKDTKADISVEQFETVKNSFPPGSSVNDNTISDHISKLIMGGEIQDGGFGYGKDMTYLKALEQGQGGSWLPDVTGREEREIRMILQSKGVTNITDQRIREYKKREIMGIR